MAVLFVYLMILCLHKDVESACKLQCPTDKPYCSDVGCIFECPEPFYINGSECVSTCGDWFVDGYRNCVETCPMNTFYEEKLRQVQSAQYLERKCVNCNNFNQFVYNGSCVKVCPADSRYIEGKTCTRECPSERPYTLNITLLTLVHHKCVEKCPQVVEDNSCRADCSSNKVIHNFICIEQCPPSSPFLFAKTCFNECPKYAYLAGYGNNTCLNKCPDERPYIANKTCVDKCPDALPVFGVSHSNRKVCFESCGDRMYRLQDQCVLECPDERPYVANNTCLERCPDALPVFMTDSGFNYCAESCGDDMYKLNDSCVSECPPSTVAVNDSCQEQCPKYAPFVCVISKGLYCGQPPKNYFGNSMCVHECPSNMIIKNQTCMFSCPDKVPAFGNECTDECPIDFRNECTYECPIDYPLQRKVTTPSDCNYGQTRCLTVKTVITCVNDCPSNSILLNNTCFSYCPSHLLLEDNRCTSTCSASKPLITSAKVTQTIWSFRWGYYYREKQDIYKCTSSCGDDMVIWNSTCVSSCPENAPYVHNKTCSQHDCSKQYSEITKSGTVCLEKCKDHELINNRTCVEACPIQFKKFNGTCVEQCPESHFLMANLVEGKTCVDMCPDGLFTYKNTCISFCPKPLFTFNNVCVEACPIDSPFSETSSVSVETIITVGNRFKKTNSKENIVKCVSVCPEGKAIFDSKCVDSCPVRLRYIINNTCVGETCGKMYKYYSTLGIRCFTECPEDLFINNDTCFLQCPDDMFSLGQNCVSECPPTHGFIYEEIIGRNEMNCTYYHFKEKGYMCADIIIDVKKCLRRCPDNTFIYKNRCLDFCSHNNYTFNNTCVETCPISHSFAQPALRTTLKWEYFFDGWFLHHVNNSVKVCVVECGKLYLQSTSECVEKCPLTDPFTFKNVCVKKCPDDKLIDEATKTCVDKCAKDKGLFNKTCYSNCPSKLRYIHYSQCKAECPSSAPVALKEEKFICRESCPDTDELFNEEKGECISRWQCDEPMFEYNRLCISRCPEGFIWLNVCHDRNGPIIAIPGLGLLFIVVFVFNLQNLKDFYWIFRLVFVSEEELEKIEANQRQQYKKPVSKEKKDDDIPFYVAEDDTDITSETVL